MPFIDQNRVICDEKTYLKWYVQRNCTLENKDGSVIVFDYELDQFRYQDTDRKSWNEYLLKIGNLKLEDTQKLDSQGNIVQKTEDELFAENRISLSDLKLKYSEKVNETCSNKITSGFRSSALGEEHIYDSEDYDQWNMIGAAAVQSSTLYKCRKASTEEEVFMMHSSAQMIQVLRDGASLKLFYMVNAKNLKDRIQAASSYDQLKLIDLNSGWAN